MSNKKFAFLVSVIVIAMFSVIFGLISYIDKHYEVNYSLSEITDGTYVIYYHTVSSAPAHNYDVVEICYDGQITTFKGKVNITYMDIQPYAVITVYPNAVNFDKIQIYVPSGTVLYQESVGIR